MRTIWLLLCWIIFLFGHDVITPIPQSIPYDKTKAALGKALFFDTSLSHDGKVSCATCHKMEHGGADTTALSLGVDGKKGRMNTPTILNAIFNFRQFWNGRAKNLSQQLDECVHNPQELGVSTKELLAKLARKKYYQQAFRAIFGADGITYEHYKEAIIAYEKSLITPNSKFDRFLRGETKLSPLEMRGWQLFRSRGCIMCHNGINIGGNSLQKVGVIVPYTGKPLNDRYTVTKDPQDRYVYKVPTLRNVALTAPYFHDGSVATLQEAIKKVGYYNLGILLPPDEIKALVAFLHTLTGKMP